MTDGPDGTVTVRDIPDRQRFVIEVDGAPVGSSAYRFEGAGTIAFQHTEVDDAVEGRGLGSVLVRAALDEVAGRGLAVLPRCPFVRSFIEAHPEYVRLVPAAARATYALG